MNDSAFWPLSELNERAVEPLSLTQQSAVLWRNLELFLDFSKIMRFRWLTALRRFPLYNIMGESRAIESKSNATSEIGAGGKKDSFGEGRKAQSKRSLLKNFPQSWLESLAEATLLSYTRPSSSSGPVPQWRHQKALWSVISSSPN